MCRKSWSIDLCFREQVPIRINDICVSDSTRLDIYYVLDRTRCDIRYPGLILGLCPANERRRYKVTPSLIGWAQT